MSTARPRGFFGLAHFDFTPVSLNSHHGAVQTDRFLRRRTVRSLAREQRSTSQLRRQQSSLPFLELRSSASSVVTSPPPTRSGLERASFALAAAPAAAAQLQSCRSRAL